MPWRPVHFKDNRVLARCDGDGKLVVSAGRVEIRYKPTDGRAYNAAARNLGVIDGEDLLDDGHCAPVSEPGARSKPRKKSGAVAPTPPEGAVVAYTDGACSGNPGPAGVGVVLIEDDRRRELSEFIGEGTNNVAELTAIGSAADAVEDPERPVHIHTDSKYAIGVLTLGWKAKKNRELIALVKASLARLSDVTLVYVPGHSGIPLNERADELAVLAVQERVSSGWEEAV